MYENEERRRGWLAFRVESITDALNSRAFRRLLPANIEKKFAIPGTFRPSGTAHPSESSRRGCKVLMTGANRLSSGCGMERDAGVPNHPGINGRGPNGEPPHHFFVIRSFIEIAFSSPARYGRCVPPRCSMCNIRVISASSIFIAICVRKWVSRLVTRDDWHGPLQLMMLLALPC